MHLDIEIFKDYAVVLKSSSGNDSFYNWNSISKWINSKILIIPKNFLRQNLFYFHKCFRFLVRQKRHDLKSNSNFPQGLKEKTLVISCLFSSNHLVSFFFFFFFFATECKKKKKKQISIRRIFSSQMAVLRPSIVLQPQSIFAILHTLSQYKSVPQLKII